MVITSVSPNEIRAEIIALLKKYDVNPLGNFSGLVDATIFESNARERTPPGRNRVFIWVKPT
jgi:hypothetical protein